jgi:hypothetical protein
MYYYIHQTFLVVGWLMLMAGFLPGFDEASFTAKLIWLTVTGFAVVTGVLMVLFRHKYDAWVSGRG